MSYSHSYFILRQYNYYIKKINIIRIITKGIFYKKNIYKILKKHPLDVKLVLDTDKNKKDLTQFINYLVRSGCKGRIIKHVSKIFIINITLFKFLSQKLVNSYSSSFINLNFLFTNFINNISPLITLISTRIERKKRKAMRTKQRFTYALKYLNLSQRNKIIYK